MRIILIGLVAFAGISSALFFVSDTANPGDSLFSFDRGFEDVYFFLSPQKKKADLYAQFAKERFLEIERMMTNQETTKIGEITQAIVSAEQYIKDGLDFSAKNKNNVAIISLKNSLENLRGLVTEKRFFHDIVPSLFQEKYGVSNQDTLGTCVKERNSQELIGLIHCTKETEPGYVLFQPGLSPTTFLVDQWGRFVHSWTTDPALNGFISYLFPNGDIVRGSGIENRESRLSSGGGDTGILERISWDGEVEWRVKIADDNLRLHHDIEVLPNGNILAIAWEYKSPQEALAAGYDPEKITEDGLWPDVLLEIKPIGKDDFEIVWQWHFWDHMVQDRDPSLQNYGVIADNPDKLDINFAFDSVLTTQEDPADLLHCNGLDYHVGLNQIAVSCEFTDEMYLIDHTSSELLYRFGNQSLYGIGSRDERILRNPHDVGWIDDDTFLVFNNNIEDEQSYIIEFTAPLQANGGYASYDGVIDKRTLLSKDLYSESRSGAQRLPSGNMLVTSADTGIIVQLTEENREVWRYVVPVGADGRVFDQSDDEETSTLFKARWYPFSYLAQTQKTAE